MILIYFIERVSFVICLFNCDLCIVIYLIVLVATWKGLEPSTSSVTGWHSNQLNYQAAWIWILNW